MLHSISWQTYFSGVAILMAGYYTAIWFLYFRKKPSLDQGDHVVFQQSQENSITRISDHSNYMPKEEKDSISVKDDTVVSATDQSFLDELEALTSATGSSVNDSTIVSVIQNLIKKYPSLKDLSDFTFMNAAITDACKRNCAIELSKENIKQLWFG